MDVVIIETAKELKKHGFTQPSFMLGQTWSIGIRPLWPVSQDIFNQMVEYNQKKMLFHPTATDILRCLDNASLTFFTGKFVVYQTSTGDYLSEYHDNPAEACAEAWLNANKTV